MAAATAVLAGAALVGAGWAAERRRRVAGSVEGRRIWRSARLVRLGTALGRVEATYRARRVFASAGERAALDEERMVRSAEELARQLGQMKGAMMKLGQMASYLDEGLPEPVRQALAGLQADAPPMAPELARATLESELGSPVEAHFARFDFSPIAAASIGQVHRALLRDGRAVAVKIQYPGVADALRADLDNTGLVLRALGLAFPSLDTASVADELRARISEELDYLAEAANAERFASFFQDHPTITIPRPVLELTTPRVLVSDLMVGSTLAEARSWSQEERNAAGETIFRFVFRSLYLLGAFNGDPHPGNYLLGGQGRVAFVDFGLVKTFEPDELAVFLEMVRAMVLERDPEHFRSVIERAGLLKPGAPVSTEEVADYFGAFYDLVAEDKVVRVLPSHSSSLVRRTFAAGHPVTAWANVPPPFVVIQRINLGLYAVLAELGAEANWRRIAEEIWPMTAAPPSTPIGEAEAKWLASARLAGGAVGGPASGGAGQP